MTTLKLLPTLERIPTKNGSAASYGVTLSVGTELGQPPNLDSPLVSSFLRPWTWADGERQTASDELRATRKLHFFSCENGHVLRHVLVKAAAPPPPTNGEPGFWSNLRGALEDRFKLYKKQAGAAEAWQWPIAKPVDPQARPWAAFMGQVSTLPWPLPQVLGLSMQVHLSNEEADLLSGSVVVVPELEHLSAAAPTLLKPEPHKMDDKNRACFSLGVVSGHAVEAVANLCPAVGRQTGKLLDLQSLWVQPGPGALAGTDWRQGLEDRLADALDVPALIIAELRGRLQNRVETDPGALRRTAREVLKELSKILSLRGRGDASGSDFISKAMRVFEHSMFPSSPLGRDRGEDLAKSARNWFQNEANLSLADWLACAREVVARSGANAPAVLDPDSLKHGWEGTPARLLAELEQVRATLAADDTTFDLLDVLWRKFVAKAGRDAALADLMAAVRKARTFNPYRELLNDYARREVGRLDGISKLGSRAGLVRALKGAGLVTQVGGVLARSREVFPVDNAGASQTLSAQAVLERALYPERAGQGRAVAEGISIQVEALDDLANDVERANAGITDPLEEVQGFVTLMRPAGVGDWYCLNFAEAWVRTEKLDVPVVLPARVPYQNGLRAPVLTYDNEPLTVGGPLAHGSFVGASFEPQAQRDEHTSIDEPLVEFRYSTKAQMPGLAFGRTFEVASFAVSNSGAVPAELAQTLRSTSKLEKSLTLKRDEVPTGSGVVSEFEYLRDVPVGAIRDNICEELVPPGLVPLAAERPVVECIQDRMKAAKCAPIELPIRVALLAPAGMSQRPGLTRPVPSERRFTLSCPTVALKVWERWIGYNADTKVRRGTILAEFAKRAQEAQSQGATSFEAAGVYLSDPAVGWLAVQLVELRLEKGRIETRLCGTRRVEFVRPSNPASPLAAEQALPIDVRLQAQSDGSVEVSVGNEKPLIGCSEGVYWLMALSLLKSHANERFGRPKCLVGEPEPFSWEQNEKAREIDPFAAEDANYVPRSPWHMLIEVARPLSRSVGLSGALINALTLDDAEASRGLIAVKLDLRSEALSGLCRDATRAVLSQQDWEWQGRPPAPCPELNEPGASPLGFEMSEFGLRSDGDAVPRTMTRSDPWPYTSFAFNEDLNAPRPKGDGRALLRRFGVRVFSRYAGILPDEDGFVDGIDPATSSRWQKHWMPWRRLGPIPSPTIRLVLPMTGVVPGNSDAAAGLLVVADGSWYETGGLAERLQVEVVSVLSPACPEDQKEGCTSYYQVGTDPIQTGDGILTELALVGDTWGALDARKYQFEFNGIIGAVGHRQGLAPFSGRFDACSFVIPPPKVCHLDGLEIPVADMSGWFLKLRFRRAIATAGADPGSVSEPSAAFWVQMLPPVDRLEHDWFPCSPQGVVRLDGAVPQKPSWQWSSSHGDHLFLVGLVTEVVCDYSGRRGQECYRGLWCWTGNNWLSEGLDALPENLAWVRVHWLEVQSRDQLALKRPAELWEKLFGPTVPDRQRARIVRISRPLSVVR